MGPNFWERVKEYLDLVTFEHTIFALPFAYLGIVLGAKGMSTLEVWFWVTAIMVGARTFGMGMNRLIDQPLDAENPRTADRALPAGRIRRRNVWRLVAISAIIVVVACANLNFTTLLISPIVLAVMWAYSYLKRITYLCHFVLGAILGCAPVLGWIAATGQITQPALDLALAVLFWVAGFDIIYASLDVEFDRGHLLWSIPSYLGIAVGFIVSKLCHILTMFFLLLLGIHLGLGILYWLGFVAASGLLYYQHRIVSPAHLSRVNQSFFVMNGWVSVILFAATLADVVIRSPR